MANIDRAAIIAQSKAEQQKHYASQRTTRIVTNVIVYVILVIMCIIWVAPIIWVILQSFTGQLGTADQKNFVPATFSLKNYYSIFTNRHVTAVEQGGGWLSVNEEVSAYNFFWSTDSAKGFVFGSFMVTLLIAVFTAIFSTLFTLATAYAFSRLRFKARQPMMRVILILGMFPGFVGMVVLYNIFRMIGLTGTIWSLIIIYSGGAGMGYYISKGFFDTISKQIDEAAMVDGATRFQIFYKITLPLSKPIVVYTLLTSFMGPWAEYITSSYILGGAQNNKNGTLTTVATQLYDMINATDGSIRGKYWGEFCAGAVLIGVPVSLLFIAMQKNYVGGVTGGAVKG
ncbi:MAG: ABC transporter permease subunit [Bacilli bacterium]|nr:ABC transporter permease subunit [Bacilli bacterium]